MKVGDLIRYNAAGQRNKTLGLILDEKQELMFSLNVPLILIQWCMVGEARLLPRKYFVDQIGETWNYDNPRPGEYAWYRKGDWFEVIE